METMRQMNGSGLKSMGANTNVPSLKLFEEFIIKHSRETRPDHFEHLSVDMGPSE